MAERIRTVEHEPDFGWIARDSATGEEIMPNFRWSSRSVARTVVAETRLLSRRDALEKERGDGS